MNLPRLLPLPTTLILLPLLLRTTAAVEMMQEEKRIARENVISGVIQTKEKVAWENDPIEIPCYKPRFFVVWKFTKNQTLKVITKDGPGPVIVSTALCPAVHCRAKGTTDHYCPGQSFYHS